MSKKLPLCLLLSAVFSSGLSAEPLAALPLAPEPASEILTDSIESLQEVESELLSLSEQVSKLTSLLADSQTDSTALRASLTKYRERVEQLSKRYVGLLKICDGFKKSSEANRLAWQIGVPAALAVGIIGGLLLGGQR
jgi:peptidoglycan hydrolase CwlO-like protein